MSRLVNCLHTKVKYAPETLLMSINTHACVYRLKLSTEEKCDPQLTAIPGLHLWMTRTVWSTYEESSEVCLKRMRKLLNIHRQVITIISIRLLQHHSHSRGCGLDVSNHSRLLSSSELSGERGLTCQFNIDLFADVRPCLQPEIHTIRAVNELLELHCCYPLPNFPNAIGRPLWSKGAKRMIVETSIKVVGNCLTPSATGRHCCLCCLPPQLRLTSTELMMNVEELGSHVNETLLKHPRVNGDFCLS